MLKQGRGGRIVGASSAVGKQGAAGSSAYCASKFAVRGLTQSLGAVSSSRYAEVESWLRCIAQELGASGITVNAYAPGAIETPMRESLIQAWALEIEH
jgi:NAD(P)-dependent dehydrogenase (short-subunit alcohol dehydrogenase family)